MKLATILIALKLLIVCAVLASFVLSWFATKAPNPATAEQFERSPNCELCGSTPIGRDRHAHEAWVYDTKAGDPNAGVARLVGLQTICRMCHFVIHPGFVECAVYEGRLSPDIHDEIERHFCSVNKCKPQHYRQHRQQAERWYSKLTKVKSWTIDFGPFADKLAGP